MRIYHVLSHLRLGAGRYITDLAIEQARQGYVVAVCVSDDVDGHWRSDPHLLSELATGRVRVLGAGDVFHRGTLNLRNAALALRQDGTPWSPADVVHAHTAMAAAVGRWSGAPTVVATCHGWNPERATAFDLQDALAFSLCDGLSSPSRHWADRVAAVVPLGGVRVIPYGFDLTRYPALHTEETTSVRPPRIVCLGELSHRKGQDVLLAAMPAVWQTVPNAEVHLMGSGDAVDHLRTLATAVDPTQRRVYFRGFVPEPYGLLNGFDLMCLPTRSDNQPVAIIEAMLAGLPVVATAVGGIPEMIGGREWCAVVPPDDAVALAGRISEFLRARGPDAVGRRVDSCRSIRAFLDIRRHGHEVETWYQEAHAGNVPERTPEA